MNDLSVFDEDVLMSPTAQTSTANKIRPKGIKPMFYLTLEEEIELYINVLTEFGNPVGGISERILSLNEEYKRRKLEDCQAPKGKTAQCCWCKCCSKAITNGDE